ncbi:MAG TPA: hypothetical protein VGN76_00320, partial [Gemmatimonadales bacterium]|nr:hypothetical protein [Gemmatimonadales bacterium]
MRQILRIHPTALLAPMLLACTTRPGPAALTGTPLSVAESLYADVRTARDRIDVSIAAGRTGTSDATPLAAMILDYDRSRRVLASRLAAIDSAALRTDDSRALGLMRRTLARDLDSLAYPLHPEATGPHSPPDCGYDPSAVAAVKNGLDSLRQRLYACYGWAQSHVVFQTDTLDRLTILSAMSRSDDPGRRRRLFLSLDSVWRSVNRNNEPASPYRQLIAEEARQRGSHESPAAEQARGSGVPPDSLERWLVGLLTTWRAVNPDSLVEPWDWYYITGRASRILSSRVSRERLAELNQQVYRSLGADVKSLRVQYDLAPRPGKTPVAYTTFGARPRLLNGRWQTGEPWVFATYRTGGLDNLNELLHETGHAVHIAAIRTRPAYADWPDSDPFTEAVADFVALDVYEPVWQQRWLGDSVPLADGLRGRYGGIVMDVAWALFELRMLRDPRADPNEIWTALTRGYLRIRPHPELSWWAMRAQLIDAPGYMMNYAAGAILIA